MDRLLRLSSFQKSAKKTLFFSSIIYTSLHHKTNGIIIVNHSMEMIYYFVWRYFVYRGRSLLLIHGIINAKNKYKFFFFQTEFYIFLFSGCMSITCLFFTSNWLRSFNNKKNKEYLKNVDLWMVEKKMTPTNTIYWLNSFIL